MFCAWGSFLFCEKLVTLWSITAGPIVYPFVGRSEATKQTKREEPIGYCDLVCVILFFNGLDHERLVLGLCGDRNS